MASHKQIHKETKGKEGMLDWYFNSGERLRHLSRTDVFIDVRFSIHENKQIYRIHKCRGRNRLARVIPSRGSAHSPD